MELPDTPEMNLVYRYAEAWNRLDLDIFASFLASEVTYTSQHVFDELRGREEVEAHLRQKMEAVRSSAGEKVRAEIGLCGSQSDSMVHVAEATEKRPCVVFQQGPSEKPVALVLLDVEEKGANEGKVTGIAICTVAPHPSTARRTGIYPGFTGAT